MYWIKGDTVGSLWKIQGWKCLASQEALIKAIKGDTEIFVETDELAAIRCGNFWKVENTSFDVADGGPAFIFLVSGKIVIVPN